MRKITIRKDKLEFLIVLLDVFVCLLAGVLLGIIRTNIFNILIPFIIYSGAILFFIKKNKLYLRAHIIIMIYFFVIGLVAGSLAHIVLVSLQGPFSFALFGLLYQYYILLLLILLSFLPVYKYLIEKQEFIATLEDSTGKYAIINVPADIFLGMAPGLYVAIFEKRPIKTKVLVKKTKEGLKIIKEVIEE